LKVYLVRHGKALPSSEDPAQPLSKEGRAEIENLARTLANLNIRVGKIVHSGKLRAEETAMIIADKIGPLAGIEKADGLSPNDHIDQALEMIKKAKADLMIVSHLPFLANLLEGLVRPAVTGELPSFGTGDLIGVEKAGKDWRIFARLGPLIKLLGLQ
jgi:phosphohistidine phosphatase